MTATLATRKRDVKSKKPEQAAKPKPAPNPRGTSARCHTVLVCSPKGGSSKTTTCRALAVAAAQQGLKTATLDLDRQRTLSKWWMERPGVGVVQFDHHEGRLDEVGAALKEIEAEDYEIVIIDTPPNLEDHPSAIRDLIAFADLVLVPTGQGKDDRDSVIPFMTYLKEQKRAASFVIGRAKKRTRGLDLARASLVRAGRLCPVEIYDTEDIANAVDHGLTALDISKARGAEELEGLWHYVKNELGV
jgi:chromosome partitioning protein